MKKILNLTLLVLVPTLVNSAELVIPYSDASSYPLSSGYSISNLNKYIDKEPCTGDSKSSEITRDRSTIETSEQYTFYSNPIDKKIQIKSISIEDGILDIKSESSAKYEEYTAPVQIQVNEVHYKARPLETIAADTLLLGLPIIFSPKNAAYSFAGCTERKVNSYSLNLSKKIKTNKTEWIPNSDTGEIIMTGLGQERKFSFETGHFVIDLHDVIMEENFKTNPVIQINCSNCIEKDIQSLNFDFIKYKNKQIKLAEKKKSEEENYKKIQIQLEQERVLREKINKQKELEFQAQRKKEEEQKKKDEEQKKLQAKIAPVEKAKTKCLELGYKKETDKFKDCVLELIK